LKLKCRPEDFRVDEQAAVKPGGTGRFGLYVLEKRGLSTFEAIERLAWHMGRPSKAINAGGLKDKYAITRQHITIAGQAVPAIRMDGLSLKPLGRVAEPMTGAQLLGNRFRIVLRDIRNLAEADLVGARMQQAAGQGLPNYFDEQRFGSLRAGRGFIARYLIDGDPETALRLHIGSPSRLDAPAQRARRRTVEEHWGNWERLLSLLPRSSERSAVAHLCSHPGDFAGAFATTDPRLCQLFLFAYQSYIWNEILGRVLQASLGGESLFAVRYAPGRLWFFDSAPAAFLEHLAQMRLPLPTEEADYGMSEQVSAAARAALDAERISLDRFRVPDTRQFRFRAGSRPVLVRPADVAVGNAAPDELYPGRIKKQLSFTLPPGSYATLFLKYVGRDLLPGSRPARGRRQRRKRP
jgi:tRNA pseudouridine13 synthase